MNKVRSTVHIVVHAAALTVRLTRCVAIRLIGHATERYATGATRRAPIPDSAPAPHDRWRRRDRLLV